MNEDLNQKKRVISELKDLLEKAEEIEESKDVYCMLLKTMILNTYCEN